jgi:hypothetical protein
MTRLQKLRLLIGAPPFNGSIRSFAERIKRAPSQVSQWLGEHRRLGDAGARNIELQLGLDPGWFDLALTTSELKAEYKVSTIEETPDAITAEILTLLKNTDHVGRKMALVAVRVALMNHNPAKKKRRT